ncbi:MAG: peptidylprolyl isomerase [Desulfuromonadaceae bacterium]
MIRWTVVLLLLMLPAHACPDGEGVVAMAGGVAVSTAEFDRELLRLQKSQDLSQALRAMDPERRREILEEYLDRKQIVLGALKEGIDKDAAVAAEIRDAQDKILLDAYLARKLGNRITPDAAREFYEKNRNLFQQSPKVKARHILLKTSGEADSALQRVKGGEDFCTVSEAVSIDQATRRKCGELGWIDQGVMVRSFEEYLYSLKPGGTGGVTETSYGFHLVQVTERSEGEIPKFEAVSNVVMQKLRLKLLDELRLELKREFPVSIK